MRENEEKTIFNNEGYTVIGQDNGPDELKHYVVYSDEHSRGGLIYNKRNLQDAGFYSPYLVYVIGKKVGIDTPETRVGIFLEKDIYKQSYMDSFFDSSLVYDDTMNGRFFLDLKFSFEDPNRYISQKEWIKHYKKSIQNNSDNVTIDDFVNSMVYFFTNYTAKKADEYSAEEIDSIKQIAIDRIMFGLKLGIRGENTIAMKRGGEPYLLPYNISSRSIFSLNVNEKWIREMLAKKEKEFLSATEREYEPQFKVSHEEHTNLDDSLQYLFEKYPNQAQKAYDKLRKYSTEDLRKDLDDLDILDYKKEFALRVFELRNRIFKKEYDEHIKQKNDDAR